MHPVTALRAPRHPSTPPAGRLPGRRPLAAGRGLNLPASSAHFQPPPCSTVRASASAQPIKPGSAYPAGATCSTCGLCDTPFIASVRDACAFLGDGMARLDALEPALHGRSRDGRGGGQEDQLGVIQAQFLGRMAPPPPGAATQWSGIVTSLACAALEAGLVDGVACVASQPDDPLCPRPILARTAAEVRAAAGVKPSLSPSLELLPQVADAVAAGTLSRLLFIGVGCQVQALRAVAGQLGLASLLVLGTNCTDNGWKKGLETFLASSSASPSTARHYEFHVDYRVHIVHADPAAVPTERIPYFSLPASKLTDVIAPSCYSCFDYTNGGADLVVGYMGAPYGGDGTPMRGSWQHVVVRNARGAALVDALSASAAGSALEVRPVVEAGSRTALVRATVEADDAARRGEGPTSPMPIWLGTLIARLLTMFGPRGIEFARYSVDYHVLRNFLYTRRHLARKGGASSPPLPAGARAIVEAYNADGWVDRLLAAPPGPGPGGPVVKGRGADGWWVGGGRAEGGEL